MRQPEKVGTVSDTGTTHVTLVKVPCSQLRYIPYVFKHRDLLVLKIMYNIVRSRVHYTLQSKSRYYIQNKIFCLQSRLVKGWQLRTQSDTLYVDEEGVKIPPETSRTG